MMRVFLLSDRWRDVRTLTLKILRSNVFEFAENPFLGEEMMTAAVSDRVMIAQ